MTMLLGELTRFAIEAEPQTFDLPSTKRCPKRCQAPFSTAGPKPIRTEDIPKNIRKTLGE